MPYIRVSNTRRVTFTAGDLEGNPTQFAVALEECGNVTSVDYDDEQGNSPDFSQLPDPTCVQVSDTNNTDDERMVALVLEAFGDLIHGRGWGLQPCDRGCALPSPSC